MDRDHRLRTGQQLLGARIRERRTAEHLGLAELAQKCGLSLTYLSNVEHGHRQVSLGSLLAIADALGTTVTGLVGGVYPFDAVVLPDESAVAPACGRSTRARKDSRSNVTARSSG